jgi:hypothetical protein
MTALESDRLAQRFEEHRAHLRAVGYRIHGEESLHARVPDPIVSQRQAIDPEHADLDGNNMMLRQRPSSAP